FMPRPAPFRSRRSLKRAPLRPMALEPRLMFDGAAVDTAVQAAADAAAAAASARSTGDTGTTDSHPGNTASSVPPATEIVFITTSTPEWQKLASNVRAGVEVVLLDPEHDGLAQIDAALAGRTGITALHFVSHGADGMVVLGNTPLDTDGLVERASEVAAWRGHLSADADILLYGCDVAADTQGRAFADLLAQVTGADVAASSDTTGAAARGGDWNLEYASGHIETAGFLTAAGIEAYDARLATINLSGANGWTAIMFGLMRDPDGDSQAGAADTDIIGDSAHGSLYTAYSDNGTAGTADDYLYFRMRIDNPTSDTDFSGVAIVGMDANGDGRVDLFMSVDGRNNTRAVRLLDPGTGANLSPNTTTTSPLPTGWLANNGVYAFSPSNYSVDAVSSLNDPHYGPSTVNPATGTPTDLTGDGKRDVFISWRVPLADIAAVLAKPSPVDRNGVYGPRGASGLAGFDQNTPVRYVSFTQTQPGPINGDLNGVGSSYDKNATFAALGAFTTEMSASNPVAASTRLDISDNVAGIANGPVTFTFQFSEGVTGFDAGDITVSNGTKGTFTAVDTDTYTLVVTPTPGTASGTIQVDVATDAARSIAGNLPTAAATATQAFDTLAPQIGIATPASALSGTPTLQGTTDLPDGSLITVTIDPDNNPATANDVIYKVMAAGGLWTLNTATTAPLSGSLPAGGLVSYSKVTASGTDAAGNTASAVELNPPTVTAQTTSNTTPTVSGTWTNIPGDTLSVTVNGTPYTPAISGNTWTVSVTSALAVSATPYEVVATVTRGSAVSDTTSGELTISSAPPTVSVDITGGATASGSDTTPVITGSSANAGGYLVVRLDPGNDGNLTDAVTYSVTPDGSGNWTLDTGSATPIAGTVPSAGFIGAVGIRATDSTASTTDTQVLTVTSPSVSITTVSSTATTDANAQVNNGDAYINMTEDNAVTISGSATVGFTVHLVIADANGNSLEYSNVAVNGSGIWTVATSDIGALDSTTLTMTASLSGTGISVTNTGYTHDAIAPRIFITNPSEIKKNGGILYGGSELANTSLTVTIRNSADTTTVYSGSTTTNASGDWTITTSGNLVSGSSGNVIIRVAPTAAPATDAAKNIVGTAEVTQYVAANAVTSSIAIGTIATANTISVGDIGSGLAITGTTTLSGTGTVTLSVDDGDVGTAANFTATGSYSGGAWTVNLTKAQVQSLLNGQLTVTASAQDISASPAITISDVALPTLSLLTPTLGISDDTPGTAGGPVTFTFQFSEGVTGFDAGDITVSNGAKGTFTAIDADTYTLVVTPTPNSSGDILVQVGNNIATGQNTGRGNGDASASQPFNTTVAAAAPSLTINADALASDSTPVITGTSSLPAGAPIVVTIDPDNDSATANSISYAATVAGDGSWSVDTGSATPTSGSLPAGGLNSWAKVTATATNAYGNSTSVTALDIPAVTPTLSHSATATVHGTWTNLPGDTLSVAINGTTHSVANGNLSISGNTWSLTTAALTDGTYSVTATVSRSGPDSRSDLSSNELVIDTLGTVDIMGGASVLTNDATPLITGTTTGMPAGTLLTVGIDTDNNGSYDLSYQTTIAADGSWSVDTGSRAPSSGSLPPAGLNGTTPIRASATDPAGNTGIDTQTLDVDLTPPQVTLTSGSRSPSSQPVITGTTDLPAGSTVTLVIDPDNLPGGPTYTYTAIVQPDGTWRVDTANPTAAGGSGPNQSYPSGTTLGLAATATDSAGNSTTAERPLAIDSTTPTVAIQTPLDANGTPDGSLDATEDDNAVIRGTTTGLADGKTLTITITDGTTTLSDTATVSGNSWALPSFDLSFLAAGRITVTATHTDDGGNTYSDTAAILHVKNSTVSIERISEDTGIVADFITRDNTVSIQGTATPGATVTLLVKDGGDVTVASFSVVANATTGAWSTAATSALGTGTYTIDAAVGAQHATRSMTIVDSTPPLLTGSTPADNATGVAVGADLTLSFNRSILPGSGTVSLYRSSDGSLVESYNVSTGLGSITDSNGIALGSIRFSGSSLTLNPGVDLDANTRYYIRVDNGAVIDQAGNTYAGIADSTTLDFRTVGGANQPPIVTTSGGSAAFSEGVDTTSTPVVVDSGLTLSDTDSPTLAGASVALTGNFQSGQDVLAFTNDGSTMGNIAASYNSGTGVLTLSSAGATATLAQWQAALRSVTYTNSSDTPSAATRTVSFIVDDGTDSSSAATRTVTVEATNDSPAISAPASIGVTENTPGALTGISFSDPDAGSASLTVTFSVASGTLSATSATGVTVGGTSTALTLTGSSADLNAFIAGGALGFQSAANATATVSLGISVDDAGNTGSGGAKSDSTTVALQIGALNDAPIVTTSGGSAAFSEGVDTTSTPVVVDSGLTLSDTDSPTLAGASVALTGNFQSGQDVLAFTNDGSTMGNIAASYNSGTGVLTLSSAGATATLAQWQAALRSVTYTNSSDTPSAATRTVSFIVDDGTDSSSAATRTVTVEATNDSPAISAPASIGVTENTPGALTGISFSDPDAGSASLTVTFSVASGTLSATSATGVTVGGTSTALTLTGSSADLNAFIAGGALGFQSAANATATVSLGISVDDAGNTGSGGAKSDSTTVALQIGALNDAPIVTTSGGSAAFTGGGSPVAVDSGLTVVDIDSPTLASASVALTGNFQSSQDVLAFTNDGSSMGNITASYNSSTGQLTLTSAGATSTLAEWQAALRSVTYGNSSTSPLSGPRTVSFTVNDGSDSSALASRDVSVSPPPGVNPEITGPSGGPGAANSAISVPENTTQVASFNASESVTWSLTGDDAGRFQLDAAGQLRFVTAPDFEAPTDQGDGPANNTYVVQVRATDADNNVAVQTITVTVTNVVEATAPTQTVSIERMGLDTGDADNDFVTANGGAGRSVVGSLNAPLGQDEVVELSFDGGQTWVRASITGTSWSAVDPSPHAGSWSIQARVGNPAAGLSGPLTSRAVTLDTTPPAAPTVDALDTTSTTPTLSGSAQVGPGEHLSVTVGGTTYTVGDGHLSLGDGRWTLTLPADAPLGTGTHSVLARITDPAGNRSDDLSAGEITISDVPPPRPQQPSVVPPTVPVDAPV
ncbi:DUF4347 domain-containing protein, partial [Zoogloea sp.]|uniref:DUF4347 domain-containing protein n=1 Tax=Zoogloea sp. TaxID=49181 RepID=UPI001415BF52